MEIQVVLIDNGEIVARIPQKMVVEAMMVGESPEEAMEGLINVLKKRALKL